MYITIKNIHLRTMIGINEVLDNDFVSSLS